MTDTLTVGNITQLVQPAGRVSWFPPMERNEFTFVVQTDPRDARIAELEAALRETRKILLDIRFGHGKRIGQAVEFIEAQLWTPESDMNITVEELDA